MIDVKNLAVVVQIAWQEPFTVQANFARRYAREVAVAASLGFITSIPEGEGTWTAGCRWFVTGEGLEWLQAKEKKDTT